jgi:hypothetical protein
MVGVVFTTFRKDRLDSRAMQTSKLAAVAVAMTVVPALVCLGCNKKEDLAPAPSATQAAAPPPPPSPPPPSATPAATAPRAPVKAAVRSDAGVRDGAVVVVALPDAAIVALPGLPQIPTIHPSALPALASSIVGGIIGAIPSGLIPPPPAPSR